MVIRMAVTLALVSLPMAAAPPAEVQRRAWAVISDALRNGSPEDQTFAAQMLARVDASEAVGLLCEALRGRAPSVRAAAANAFRTTRQPVPWDVLAASLRDETEPWVRMLLVEAIARSTDPQHGQMIRPAFRDPDERVRQVAYWQIWLLPKEEARQILEAELTDRLPEDRLRAGEFLAAINAPTAAAQRAPRTSIPDPKAEPPVHATADMLRDENPQRRVAALQAMASSRDSGLLSEAEKVFLAPGEHPKVIAAAASAIAETAGSKALRLLESALDSDRAPVRIAAAVELLRVVRFPSDQ